MAIRQQDVPKKCDEDRSSYSRRDSSSAHRWELV